MIGSTIKVVATAESGNTFESEATEEVGVYEALEILSAEQTGQYTADLTFSAPVTADDAIKVTKGGNAVEFKKSIDTDKLGATLTFTDALTTGEYTVTLTPKDTTVKPSSVTFEAERSKLTEIRFLNDVLVMKDHYYNEGYAYVKGYDQFGNEKILSGLNVVSGVGTFKSYDSDTGKITIKDDTVAADQTGAFLMIKEVPVFVQYQEGTNVVSESETLTVSTRAYLAEMEFGEVKKNSKETADRLTLDELRSGLWYVEINGAKDQWGNELSADDIQSQTEGNSKVLFVIPGNTGAFYTTGKFTDLDGQTVLWLDGNAASKPGKMDLSITGAGGKTFTKEGIEIFDNPFIDTLTVDYPDLYEGMTESKQLNFSAVDQYGNDIDLWDFRPTATVNAGTGLKDTLTFGDTNSMTTAQTEIRLSGGAEFNTVELDTKAKTFKVTVDVNAMQAKQMAVFTATTAGTKVATQTVTIGERGKAAKVASSFVSTKKLDPAGDWNVNADVAFVDVNGNTMTRNKNNADYPYFADGAAIFTGATAVNQISDEALPNNATITRYVWTLSENKVTNKTDALPATAKYDGNGKINGAGGTSDITVTATTPKDVYVTVFALSGAKYYVVDSATTRVTMIDGTVDKVEAVAPGTLYAAKDSTDSEKFKVKLTNKVGESWKVDASSVVAGGIFAGLTDGPTINGTLSDNLPGNTTATTPVSVYYGTDLVGTVDLTYTNVTPVPTTTKFQYTVTGVGTDGIEVGRAGVGFTKDLDETEFVTDTAGVSYDVDNKGVLTITCGNALEDTLKGWVEDQYGQKIAGTVVYKDGVKAATGTVADTNRHVWEFKNDTQGKAFYVTNKQAGADVTVALPEAAKTVNSMGTLRSALANAAEDTSTNYTITLDDDITVDETTVIPSNVKLVVPTGSKLTATEAVTVNGELDVENAGTFATSGANGKIVNNKTVSLGETAVFTDGGTTKANGTGTYEVANATQLTALGVTAAGTTFTVKVIEDLTAAAADNYTVPVVIAADVTGAGALTFGKALTIKDGGSLTAGGATAFNDDVTVEAGGELDDNDLALTFAKDLTVESGATIDIGATTAATLATGATVTIEDGTTITSAAFSLPTTAANTVTFTNGNGNAATLAADAEANATLTDGAYSVLSYIDNESYVKGAATASTVELSYNGDDALGLTYDAGSDT